MKVGSSPLYFVPGKEAELERFVEYLNHREKEAFNLLKEFQILQDEKQEPVIRVALRNLKDFAQPINVRIGDETKLFWKYFLLPTEQTIPKIREIIRGSEKKIDKEERKVKSVGEKLKKKEEIQIPILKTATKQKIKEPSKFANYIKDYLLTKDIEILETLSEKKKEFISKVRRDEKFGKQEYFLIAKDKKKINSNDLTIVLQTAQREKMPAFFISPGELDKKAQSYLQEWRNLIKFEKISVKN